MKRLIAPIPDTNIIMLRTVCDHHAQVVSDAGGTYRVPWNGQMIDVVVRLKPAAPDVTYCHICGSSAV